MNRKLIVHIGAHKTGTSSIQQYLKGNLSELRRINWDLFHKKPEGICSKDGSANAWIDFSGQKDNFSAHINHKLYAELKKTEGNLIVSSEELFWLNKHQVIKSFSRELKKIFDEITIICYLRRQDLHLYSHYLQGFKFPESSARAFYGTEPTIPPKHYSYYGSYLDYYSKIRMWSEYFGRDNIIVKEYDKKSLHKGDSVADFMHSLNFKAIDSKTLKNRTNESLNKSQLIINSCVFNVRDDLWYELGKGKFTRSHYFLEQSSPIVSDVATQPAVLYLYAGSNSKLLEFLPSVSSEWVLDKSSETRDEEPINITLEDYRIATENFITFIDNLSIWQFAIIKLKKQFRVKHIEKTIRKLLKSFSR